MVVFPEPEGAENMTNLPFFIPKDKGKRPPIV